MTGILSDLQQIYEWIDYFRRAHGAFVSNRQRCRLLCERCTLFESFLKEREQRDLRKIQGIDILKTVMKKCIDFIDKYGNNDAKNIFMNISWSLSIESEFKDLNKLLTQAQNDLQFGMIATSVALINCASDSDIIVLGQQFREFVESCGVNASQIRTANDIRRLFPVLHQRSCNLIQAVRSTGNIEHRSESNIEWRGFFQLFGWCSKNFSFLDSYAWRNRRMIGRGSLASVYRHEYKGRVCAVKFFEHLHLMSETDLTTIKREIRIMELAAHPNIIEFIDSNAERGCIICELADGSLHDAIYNRHIFRTMEVNTPIKIEWLLGIARALHYLHLHGITHRDIKPQNILLVMGSGTNKAVAKLADFGVSSAVGLSTLPGTVRGSIGTPQYMAPEAIGDERNEPMYSPAVDIFSFGVLAIELMSESRPWNGRNSMQIATMVSRGVRPELFRVCGHAETRLQRIIGNATHGCLAARPLERWSSKSLVEELKLVQLLLGFDYVKVRADKGDAQSQCQIGLCYLLGSNGMIDDANVLKAVRAAIKSNFVAEVRLVCGSRTVETNRNLAFAYFCRSAKGGDAAGQFFAGHCLDHREKLAVDMEEYKVTGLYAYDKMKAFKYFKMSADQGFAFAQNIVGSCYDFGKGVGEDLEEAFKYYKFSADQGDAVAQFNVGLCYHHGRGTSSDLNQSFKYYTLSAEQSNAAAQNLVGVCFEHGLGTSQDLRSAYRWYKRSADQGFAIAQCNVGACLQNGLGIAVNLAEAARFYRLSADQGYARGIMNFDALMHDRSASIYLQEAFQRFRQQI